MTDPSPTLQQVASKQRVKRANPKLKDSEAKAILRDWPMQTELWSPSFPGSAWVRAQPVETRARVTGPRIREVGSDAFRVQPDGLWACFSGVTCVDLMVVEACGSITNLNDKRSRYMPSGTARVLSVSEAWASELVRGGRGHRNPVSRRTLARTLGPLSPGETDIPIRQLRVLFALPDDEYRKWTAQLTPHAHEYFVRHSALHQYNAQPMQEFLKGMSPAKQYYD